MEEADKVPGNIGREKFWKELTIEEKLERLREFVKMQFDQLGPRQERLEWRTEKLTLDLGNHRHNEKDGRAGVDLSDQRELRTMGVVGADLRPGRPRRPENPDEVYI